MKNCALLSLLLVGWSLAGFGQVSSGDSVMVYPMHQVVITATRTQIPLRDSPSEVDIIDRQTIERTNGSTLADALKNSGSVFLKEYGANAALKTLSIRGSASEHVLVLVNGNRFNNFQNNLVDLSLIPLDDIERIEIVRGGNSALYGADALGGVVNILTRLPGAGSRVRTEMSGGSFGYERYLMTAQGRMGGIGLSAGYGSERGRDDFEYPSASVPGGYGTRQNSDFIRRQIFLTGDVETDDRSSLTVSLQDMNANRGAPGPAGPFESLSARQDDHDFNIMANYSDAHIDRLNIAVRSSVHYNYETFVDPNPGFPIDSRYKNLYANFNPQVQFLLSPSQKIIGGIDLAEGTLDGNDFDSKITRVQKGIYVSSESQFDFDREAFDRLSLFATLRFDHVTDVAQAFTPKFGMNIRVLKAGDIRIRANGGGNFRSPTFNDLYYHGFSNPNLKAEYSTSFDAGVMASLPLQDVESDFDASYFYLDTRDRIFFDLRTYLPENIGRVESKGWEFNYTGRLLRSLLVAKMHYAITDAIKKNPTRDNDLTVGNRLPYIPYEMAGFSISATPGDVAISLTHAIVGGRFTDDTNAEELPAYGLTNGTIAIHQTLGAWQLIFKGEVNNVFDVEYEVFKDYPVPKRNYRMTVGLEYVH